MSGFGMDKQKRLWRLVGGPQHGKVAEAYRQERGPTFLMSNPRNESFLDDVAGELHWRVGTEWYAWKEPDATA